MSSISHLPPPSSTSNSSRRHSSARAPAAASRRQQCCFSFAAYARALMDHLRRCGVRVEAGLSEAELRRVETQLCFSFPPDLRAILQEGLPTGSSFPNWRLAPVSDLRIRMQQPLLEICTEARKDKFWFGQWGSRPVSHEQAAKVAAEKLQSVPVLVPVYGNCFIPATESAGNPVLLVQSGEVSVFGNDVADFFEKEVFHSEHDCEDDEDGGVQSSCLMGSLKNSSSGSSSNSSSTRSEERWISSTTSWGKTLNPEALFFALKKKKKSMFSRGMRDIAGSRSAEASPRPSVSSTHSSNSGLIQQQHIADPPRRSLDVLPRRKSTSKSSKGVPLEALLGFTMAAPAWAAKRPKKIEFWSELCMPDDHAAAIVPVTLSSGNTVGTGDRKPELKTKTVVESEAAPIEIRVHESTSSGENPVTVAGSLGVNQVVMKTVQPQGNVNQVVVRTEQPQGWLDGYLDDMAGRLRTAGWKEADISEMMVSTESSSARASTSSCLNSSAIVPRQSRQAVIRGLVSKVQELSHSLQKSGWSVQDAAEALNASNLTLWASSQQVFSFANTAGYIAAR